MNILMIDTSGPACGVAIAREGRLVCDMQLVSGRTHSQRVMPMVEAAIAMSDMAVSDIDVFGAVTGPGSFTGVRIGVSSVKALAHAADKPCVGVDALHALAANIQAFDGVVCPILDARRDQVYCAGFDVSSGFPERVMADDAIALDELLNRLPEDREILFAGDGVEKHAAAICARLGKRALIAPVNLRDLKPEAVCALAERKQSEWIPACELRPVYLRKPQAERERNARLAREAEK